jgi:hypothetical protein
MRAICHACQYVTDLPEPWIHPGFTCPNCRAAVPLSYAPVVPISTFAPPAAPLDFSADDSPRRPIEHRNRTRATDTFAQGFGDAIGRYVALFAVLSGLCAALLFAGYVFAKVLTR